MNIIVKRAFLLLDIFAIIILFVGYLKGVKYAHGLLVFLNLINISIILKFNKMNKNEDNKIMDKREAFIFLNIFTLILLVGIYLSGVKNLFALFLILLGVNNFMFFGYDILKKRNQKI